MPGAAITYSLAQAHAGVSIINPTTGVVTITPAAQPSTVQIRATYRGITGTANLTLTAPPPDDDFWEYDDFDIREIIERLNVVEFGLSGLASGDYIEDVEGGRWFAVRPLKSAFFEISVDCEAAPWVNVYAAVDVHDDDYYLDDAAADEYFDLFRIEPERGSGRFFLVAGETYYIRAEFEGSCGEDCDENGSTHNLEINMAVDVLDGYLDFEGMLDADLPNYWVAFTPAEEAFYALFIDQEAASVQIFDSALRELVPHRAFADEGVYYYALLPGNIYYLLFEIADRSDIDEFTHYFFAAGLMIDDELFDDDDDLWCDEYYGEDDDEFDYEAARNRLSEQYGFIWLETTNEPCEECGGYHDCACCEGMYSSSLELETFGALNPISAERAFIAPLSTRIRGIVVFHPNGGTGAIDTHTCRRNIHTFSGSRGFRKLGYRFIGWSTDPNSAYAIMGFGHGSFRIWEDVRLISHMEYIDGLRHLSLHAVWVPVIRRLHYSRLGATRGTAPDRQYFQPFHQQVTIATNTGYPPLYRRGYTFAGWRTGTGNNTVEFNEGDVVTIDRNRNVTLRPIWQPNSFEVRFYSNIPGNDYPIHTQTVEHRVRFDLPVPPHRPGHVFNGWSTEPNDRRQRGDRNFRRIVARASRVSLAYTVETRRLYARWRPITYRINYIRNNQRGNPAVLGRTPARDIVTYPFYVEIRRNDRSGNGTTRYDGTLWRRGSEFVNWNTERDGTGESFEAGGLRRILYDEESARVQRGMRLFAQWGNRTGLFVTFCANGGTGAPQDQSFTANTPFRLPQQIPTRDGFEFNGWRWRPTPTGSWRVITNIDRYVQFSEDVLLSARWRAAGPARYTLTYVVDQPLTSGSVPNAVTRNANANVTLNTGRSLRRTGYVFGGWMDDAGVIQGRTIILTRDMTLTAVWRNNFHTIAYSGYYGDNPTPPEQRVEIGRSIALHSGAGIVHQGRIISEWRTRTNARRYSVGQTVTPQSDMTLYPVWGDVYVTGVSIMPPFATIYVDNYRTLEAIVHPSNATNRNVTWNSGDPLIASVSDYGVVTGMTEGTASITVTTDCGLTATSTVVVMQQSVNPEYSISVSPQLLNFGFHQFGYTQIPTQTATVTNTGTMYVMLNPLPLVSDWTLVAGENWTTPMAPNETRTFTTRPNDGLNVGGYLQELWITGNGGAGAMTSATFTVLPTLPSLVIISQPLSLTRIVGEEATFTVEATDDPLTFQWQVFEDGWIDLPGETTRSLSIQNVTLQMSGNQYRVVVINSEGSRRISDTATLTVNDAPNPPVIISQPLSLTRAEGEEATFTVAATGAPTLTFQWQFSEDGGVTWRDSDHATANTSTLRFPSIGLPADGNQYRVVVSNAYGSVTSDIATRTAGR